MSAPKDTSPAISIAFHVIPPDSPGSTQVRLEKTLGSIFPGPGAWSQVPLASGHNGELVYRIERPLMVDEPTMLSFFERLQTLFSVTSKMSPHFTQVMGEE